MVVASDRLKETDKLSADIRELEQTLETMNAPKLDAGSRLTEIKNKAKESTKELDEVRAKVLRLGGDFERVKRERYTRFTTCLDTVSTSIDLIYKVKLPIFRFFTAVKITKIIEELIFGLYFWILYWNQISNIFSL